jgi:hypothetical protein
LSTSYNNKRLRNCEGSSKRYAVSPAVGSPYPKDVFLVSILRQTSPINIHLKISYYKNVGILRIKVVDGITI